jgi:hypothetical protein
MAPLIMKKSLVAAAASALIGTTASIDNQNDSMIVGANESVAAVGVADARMITRSGRVKGSIPLAAANNANKRRGGANAGGRDERVNRGNQRKESPATEVVRENRNAGGQKAETGGMMTRSQRRAASEPVRAADSVSKNSNTVIQAAPSMVTRAASVPKNTDNHIQAGPSMLTRAKAKAIKDAGGQTQTVPTMLPTMPPRSKAKAVKSARKETETYVVTRSKVR